jgi:HPt (histidine-containing phosphotransfer) domain-containing protein
MESPQSPSGPDEPRPVLRASTIAELREYAGAAGFAAVRAEFLRDCAARADAIARAVDAGEPEPLRRLIHSLKGASGSLGAERLSALCAEIDARLKTGAKVADCRALLDRLPGELTAASRALEAA